MRSTRMFRIGTTACATALLAGAGAMAAAGTASAATAPPAAASLAQPANMVGVPGLAVCYEVLSATTPQIPVMVCQNYGLLSSIINGLL